jgi:hypothetical protein
MPRGKSDVNVDLIDAVWGYLEDLQSAFNDAGSPLHVVETEQWRRGPDGVARRQRIGRSHLGLFPHTHKETSSKYDEAAQAVRDDPDFGPIVGGLVGTNLGASQFNEDTVISRALEDALDTGTLQVDRDTVSRKIEDLRKYAMATERECVALMPLPGLKSSLFPFEVEKGIEVDNFTDNEIDACAGVGVLRPMFEGMPLLGAEECVGVRIKIALPARTIKPSEMESFRDTQLASMAEEVTKPHKFGDRSQHHLAELVEDILFVLRLTRSEFVGTLGFVLTTTSHMGTARTWGNRSTRQNVRTSYELDYSTAGEIKELWAIMRDQRNSSRSLPTICVRRFNAALDRIALDDAVVDHLIGAEALYLKDAGSPEERGELAFRLALRAASFLEKEELDRKTIYKFMKRAYDLRSRVAHGGTLPSTVKIEGRDEIPIYQFVEELGSYMRVSFKRATRKYSSDTSFGTTAYWDGLLL